MLPSYLNRRDILDLARLAAPVALSRMSFMLMGLTDAVVLARHAPSGKEIELAAQQRLVERRQHARVDTQLQPLDYIICSRWTTCSSLTPSTLTVTPTLAPTTSPKTLASTTVLSLPLCGSVHLCVFFPRLCLEGLDLPSLSYQFVIHVTYL
jgi:hypothetical protein